MSLSCEVLCYKRENLFSVKEGWIKRQRMTFQNCWRSRDNNDFQSMQIDSTFRVTSIKVQSGKLVRLTPQKVARVGF
jgi:hypothetical protein